MQIMTPYLNTESVQRQQHGENSTLLSTDGSIAATLGCLLNYLYNLLVVSDITSKHVKHSPVLAS